MKEKTSLKTDDGCGGKNRGREASPEQLNLLSNLRRDICNGGRRRVRRLLSPAYNAIEKRYQAEPAAGATSMAMAAALQCAMGQSFIQERTSNGIRLDVQLSGMLFKVPTGRAHFVVMWSHPTDRTGSTFPCKVWFSVHYVY